MQPLAITSTVFVLLSIGICGAAAGQTVYRCGPAGNQYSAQPCADGRPVDVSDRRSAEQIADARNGIAAQRRQALLMARERNAVQAASPPAQAGAIGPLPAAAPAREGVAKAKPGSRQAKGRAAAKAGDGGGFVAIVPGSKPAPKKSQP